MIRAESYVNGVCPSRIVAAWASCERGPGWANYPIWYVEQMPDHSYRMGCLQPDEQTPEMLTLYMVSEAAHRAMTAQVRMKIAGIKNEAPGARR